MPSRPSNPLWFAGFPLRRLGIVLTRLQTLQELQDGVFWMVTSRFRSIPRVRSTTYRRHPEDTERRRHSIGRRARSGTRYLPDRAVALGANHAKRQPTDPRHS